MATPAFNFNSPITTSSAFGTAIDLNSKLASSISHKQGSDEPQSVTKVADASVDVNATKLATLNIEPEQPSATSNMPSIFGNDKVPLATKTKAPVTSSSGTQESNEQRAPAILSSLIISPTQLNTPDYFA